MLKLFTWRNGSEESFCKVLLKTIELRLAPCFIIWFKGKLFWRKLCWQLCSNFSYIQILTCLEAHKVLLWVLLSFSTTSWNLPPDSAQQEMQQWSCAHCWMHFETVFSKSKWRWIVFLFFFFWFTSRRTLFLLKLGSFQFALLKVVFTILSIVLHTNGNFVLTDVSCRQKKNVFQYLFVKTVN